MACFLVNSLVSVHVYQFCGTNDCTTLCKGSDTKIIEITIHGKKAYIKPTSQPIYENNAVVGFVLAVPIVTDMVESEECIKEQLKKAQEINTIIGKAVIGLNETINTFTHEFDDVKKSTNSQIEQLDEMGRAMEEMNSATHLIASRSAETAEKSNVAKEHASHGEGLADESVASINIVQNKTSELRALTQELSAKARGTENIVSAISDIADQTNLLALNAAIEAARAGDAGRGFAVVADEVRKLAEKTMEATVDVNKSLSDIQADAMTSVQSTEEMNAMVTEAVNFVAETKSALQTIVELMTVAADQITEVASAVEEQSATSEELSRTIETISLSGEHVTSNIEKSSSSVKELIDLMHTLEDVSK